MKNTVINPNCSTLWDFITLVSHPINKFITDSSDSSSPCIRKTVTLYLIWVDYKENGRDVILCELKIISNNLNGKCIVYVSFE